ncbi:MAG: hypothetical protein JWN62_1124 [Acidimicrobiales bacterium]|nr:hypothetical protein [Acidimicrobiales bacterium]
MVTHGSIRQRSIGSFELRVFAGTDPTSGKRCYRTKTVRGNRAEAERELAAMVEIVGRGPGVAARTTVGELLERWFAIAELGWAPTTIRQTRSVGDRYLHPHIGDRALADLSAADIDDLYVRLRTGGGVGGKPLQPGSVARIHVVLRSALGQAMRWGWIWDNPAERAHRIVVPVKEMSPPRPDELCVLLNFVAERDPLLHVLLLLAAITGARRAQLLGLRWHNIDLDRGRVSFARGWVEGPQGPVLTSTKSKRSHSVDIDPTSFAPLVELHQSFDSPPRPDGYVFTDDDGATAWKPNRVTKAFLRHRRAAGLRHFRLHDLRHFMATEMLQASVPIVVVSRRLDHRRVSTTLDKYTHAVPGADAHASATLAGLLAPV